MNRWAARTAVAGTIFIALGAFWLSFTALADLAARSGINRAQAWAWPLIVDGIIVVATVSVVALGGQRAAWYPWALLGGGALISVTANAIHAVVTADADVPNILAAAVAAVPPLVLLAITHLTVILTRIATPALATEDGVQVEIHPPTPDTPDAVEASVVEETATSDSTRLLEQTPVKEIPTPSTPIESDGVSAGMTLAERQERANRLRDEGWLNKQIARELGVHPSTVGRWFHTRPTTETLPAGDLHDTGFKDTRDGVEGDES